MGAEFGDYRGLSWDFPQRANTVVVVEHGAKKNLKKKEKKKGQQNRSFINHESNLRT